MTCTPCYVTGFVPKDGVFWADMVDDEPVDVIDDLFKETSDWEKIKMRVKINNQLVEIKQKYKERMEFAEKLKKWGLVGI
jgi:hypothetical protein